MGRSGNPAEGVARPCATAPRVRHGATVGPPRARGADVTSAMAPEGNTVLRPSVSVSAADVDDLPALDELWAELLEQSGAALQGSSGHEVLERVAGRIRESDAAVAAGGRPTYRLALARIEGRPVGFASLSLVDRSLLTASCAVLVDVVHVSGALRKSGIGTALLREATGFADEVGAVDVVVNVPPSLRDVNRFYARNGFAPLVLRRTAPVAALRRRLGVDPRLDPRDVTSDLTPVQRSLRRRILLTPRRTVRS